MPKKILSSYAMDIIGSLIILNGENLMPLSKRKRGKGKRKGSLPSSYSTPFKSG